MRNLHTSVEDLVLQKRKIETKPTDHFMHEIRRNKEQKNYMIEEI